MADPIQVRVRLEPPVNVVVSPANQVSVQSSVQDTYRVSVCVAEKGAKGDTGSPGAAAATTSLPFSNITSTPTTLDGYGIQDGLSSTAASATYATRLTGINTLSGSGLTGGGILTSSRNISLTSTGVAAGTYGSPSSVPVVTIDSQGRVTSASNASFSGVSSLSQLSDVQITSPAQGDLISYNQSNLKWINIKQSAVTDGGNF